MNRTERKYLRESISNVSAWIPLAEALINSRSAIEARGTGAYNAFWDRLAQVVDGGEPCWWITPIFGSADAALVQSLADQANLRPVDDDMMSGLRTIQRDAPLHLKAAALTLSPRRLTVSQARRAAALQSAQFIRSLDSWGQRERLPTRFTELGAPLSVAETAESPARALADPLLGYADTELAEAFPPQVVGREDFDRLRRAVKVVRSASMADATAMKQAKRAGRSVRSAETRRLLKSMPLERLRSVSDARLAIGPLEQRGMHTVADLLSTKLSIEALPGIGTRRARHLIGAARTVESTVFEEMPVRIDIGERTAEVQTLLERLQEWESTRLAQGTESIIATALQLQPLADVLRDEVTAVVIEAQRPIEQLMAKARLVVKFSDEIDARAATVHRGAAAWDEFLSRPADFFAMLSELGLLVEDEEATYGSLPGEIVEAVRAFELDGRFLDASLRGYQSFGARFALVQQKVVIGDEMGLGKTVEALAAIAHLRAKGSQRFLVICPAAIVTNWIREIADKTKLKGYRVHGEYRMSYLDEWMQTGGIAVTTYETLLWCETRGAFRDQLDCIVVDEAHYIKNPTSKRAERTASLIGKSERAILLTGTPLENHIDEFKNLVSYLQPHLTVDASDFSPRRFRRQVAPAYLRRNQEDVLTELPGLVEVEEWLPMSPEDQDAYRSAVEESKFMAMRQAGLSGPRSMKLRRLAEIVEEARANGRKIIVFSYFREALTRIAAHLSGPVYGPLTGSVASLARQTMVDQFSNSDAGAVLVSQISIGGVGLNIQAASVVIICEPQLKPTAEWQAISRAHRMGQLEHVQVHRLLSEEGIDGRLVEILERKTRTFSEFARHSDTATSAPEAFDATDAEIARQLVAEERERILTEKNPAGSSVLPQDPT